MRAFNFYFTVELGSYFESWMYMGLGTYCYNFFWGSDWRFVVDDDEDDLVDWEGHASRSVLRGHECADVLIFDLWTIFLTTHISTFSVSFYYIAICSFYSSTLNFNLTDISISQPSITQPSISMVYTSTFYILTFYISNIYISTFYISAYYPSLNVSRPFLPQFPIPQPSNSQHSRIFESSFH